MTYWNKSEKHIDLNGVEIKVGDILHDPTNTIWQYYTCEDEGWDSVSVRDINGHNVGMCGSHGNVIELVNLGHYSKNLELLEKEYIDPKEKWPEDFNQELPEE